MRRKIPVITSKAKIEKKKKMRKKIPVITS